MTSTVGPDNLDAFYGGRRVAVSGGASFIGSHLTERLVALGAEVTVGDDLSSGHLSHLAAVADDVEIHVGDLRDPAQSALLAQRSEIVFHLAARHGGRGYIDSHPVACVGNAALDNTVFTAAAKASVETVVFASSACTYPVDVQREGHPPTPLAEDRVGFEHQGAAFADGEYGWAKLYGELQLAAFVKEGHFNAIACRLFNAYGPRENETHAVIALIARALARRDPFLVWGDGLQQRAFTHVADTVTGLLLAGTAQGFDAFNVGAGSPVTIDGLCEEIFEVMGWRPQQIEHDSSRPVGPYLRLPDNTKVSSRFGWEPGTPLRDGLALTIADCRARYDRGELLVADDPRVHAAR